MLRRAGWLSQRLTNFPVGSYRNLSFSKQALHLRGTSTCSFHSFSTSKLSTPQNSHSVSYYLSKNYTTTPSSSQTWSPSNLLSSENKQQENQNSNENDKQQSDKKDSNNENPYEFLKKKLSKMSENDPSGWGMFALAAAAMVLGLAAPYYLSTLTTSKEINMKEFKQDLLARGKVHKIHVDCETQKGFIYLKDNPETPAYHIILGPDFASFERQLEVTEAELGLSETPIEYTWSAFSLKSFLLLLATVGGLGLLFYFTAYRPMGASGLFGINKSRAKEFKPDPSTKKIVFSDVAGCDEAKQEIMEFVHFLSRPEKYKRLGARIPKGALLVGPPGTGKTLLAKATAGEASVPFFSTSGSDFVEMFVGVGPARVRDLFSQARAKKPCIIWIDEIDAIGKARSEGGYSGSNDERENTLNQLLVEMDGFETNEGVVVLAGTNRPDTLDKALLRPGRFDRQIAISNPDISARREIFKLHLKPLKLAQDCLDQIENFAGRLASMTPGFSGADIANVCNEAALIAARKDKSSVETIDFEAAIERVLGGLEKKTKVLSKDEKTTVAYHEAGHAVTAWFLKHASPLLKVSIVPRGSSALGYAQYLPKDNYLYTSEHLLDLMSVALGGRVAEALTFGRITTGASDDLEKVTKMAYDQVINYGMNSVVSHLSFGQFTRQSQFAPRPYSDETAHTMDEEVRKLIETAYKRTEEILIAQRDGLVRVAQLLLENEVINQEQVKDILGPRPFEESHDKAEEYYKGFEVSNPLKESAPEKP